MKRIIAIILVFFMLYSFSTTSIEFISCYAVSEKQNHESVLRASWKERFNSVDEMYDKSDLIISGVVVDYETEIRNDLVFTKSFIRISEVIKGSKKQNEIITILQTGGTYEEYTTPAIYDAPIVSLGGTYHLFLKLSDYDERYGQYYVISGGYQGLFSSDETINTSNISFGDYEINNSTIEGTPTFDYYWEKALLTIQVPLAIESTYSENMYDGIVDGIKSWENNSESPHTLITNSTSSLYDVSVTVSDYGFTNWDAVTGTYYDLETNVCNQSEIRINVHHRSDMINQKGIWQAITCHEYGHTLGLDHNQDNSVGSIMFPYTDQYYNSDGTPQYVSPCTVDIVSINEKYDHRFVYTNNSSGHTKTCSLCEYTVYEAHTYTQFMSFYRCMYCGYKTTYIPILPGSVIEDAFDNIEQN